MGSTSDGSTAARSSITLARPANALPGNVLVAGVATNADTTIAPPRGLDHGPRRRHHRRGAPGGLRQGRRVGRASVVPVDDRRDRRITGGITAYAGVDTSSPVDAVNATMNPAGTAVAAPSITTSVADTMLVQLGVGERRGHVDRPGRDDGGVGGGLVQHDRREHPGRADVVVAGSPGGGRPDRRQGGHRQPPGPGIGVLLALRPAG